MRITAIKSQVKNPDRVSVYVDGAYSFSLTYDQVLEHKIHSGQELDEPQLTALKRASDFGKAYARILNYLAVRPRSVKEVRDYSWRKHISPDDSQVIIDKLLTRGYLNDTAFARAWVEQRRLTKATSARKLTLELKQKGVAEEVIRQAIGTSEYSEPDALRQMIAKKIRQPRYQDQQKLTQYLLRQGFEYGDVRTALDEVSGEQ